MDRIRVDEIPGGVWMGTVLVRDDKRSSRGVVLDGRGHSYCSYSFISMIYADGDVTPDMQVDLTDELGLGLAGLAARVAQRLNDFGSWSDWSDLLLRLDDHEWFPEPAHDQGFESALVIAAQYLALTDRLCAAVGLELEGHEVAGWCRTAHQDDQNWNLWELHTPGGCEQWELPEADWLLALRAALAGLGLALRPDRLLTGPVEVQMATDEAATPRRVVMVSTPPERTSEFYELAQEAIHERERAGSPGSSGAGDRDAGRPGSGDSGAEAREPGPSLPGGGE